MLIDNQADTLVGRQEISQTYRHTEKQENRQKGNDGNRLSQTDR